MGVLRNVIVAILIVSLLTFVALFGQLPALRKTPIGWLQRMLCIRLPNGLQRIDGSLTGGQITRRSQRLGNYLFDQKNPVVLLLFLLLLTGSATLFLWNTVHRLPTRLLLPVPLLLALPYIFTYLCVTYKRHYITCTNHQARMLDYPYDHILFRPNTACRTCHLPKPARSKHCSLCGHCVAQCDHHCPWVNNCLGRGNYRYFLALLLTLAILQIYGAYLSWWLLRPYFNINPINPLFSKARLQDIGHGIVVAVNRGGISIAGVGLLAASTPLLPLGLLAYHCYLIWAGMTTNESQKWADWRDDMTDGFVFKATREDLRAHNRLRQHRDVAEERNNPALEAFEDAEDDVKIQWPVSSDIILVRTRDGRPPQGQEALWTRVWSLSEIENIYDLGGLHNLLEILRGK
ncbi:Palmitoyltransferase SWF1 [Lecanosticta acicola]|uniref:Palmitoyltransferase n=1 Tax=Lecanosticta acicola TaxID=111012 RepID=A0AAI8YY04_9PEZI|nr:Palmitoyltransferase SWF1 [Lecanosticta acicola]